MLLVSGGHVWSQGQIVFDNRVNNVVVARIFGVDPINPGLRLRGNDASGFPAGGQTYAGAPLDGPGFSAQLFGGPLHAAAPNLQSVRPIVRFREEFGAGFILAPASTVTVPGVSEGQPAKIQLRAWNNRGGIITNWGQVEADATIPRGESWPFVTAPLGGAFHAPPNLVGLESFNLATGAMQGLSIKINFQTNGVSAPLGYFADNGLSFAERGSGFQFGWNFDHSTLAGIRYATNSPDQRYDTFIELQTNSVWEIALGNGLYGIHVALGDPQRTNGLYRVEVEGATVEGTPGASQRWVERDLLLEMIDGRLTLRGGSGAVSNRLCFVEIARVEPVRIEPLPRNVAGGGASIRFVAEAGIDYQVQSSSNLVTWWPLGLAQLVRGDRFQFIDQGATNGQWRFYRTRTLTFP